MKIQDRWKTDEDPNMSRLLEPVEHIHTKIQAIEHLSSLGIDTAQLETEEDPRVIADSLAGDAGFIYPNYRPE